MKHWNPDLVDHVIGGFPLSGFSEDALSTFSPQSEAFTLVKGVDGQFTRSFQPGQWARWTIKLMSSSKSNDFLSALHNADLATPGGAGVVPCACNDRNGTGIMSAPECYVEKFPDVNHGNKAEAREWSIIVVNYKMFVGGT